MRMLVLLSLVGCGTPMALGTDASVDASVDVGVDAGVDAGSDAGPTGAYAGSIQPLLGAKCAPCHTVGIAQPLPLFGASYAPLLEASQLCMGERVGDCVKYALEAQAPEGGGCRTFVVRPFHREGWGCLTPAEISLVTGWIDGGMPEH